MSRFNRSSNGKKAPKQRAFGEGRGVYITNEMKQAPAYRVLTANQKLILYELIRVYGAASCGETRDITNEGLVFTYGMVLEDVDDKTFRDARKRLCDIGFFAEARDLKQIKPGAPNKYVPSIEWRNYKPTPNEAKRLRRYEDRKTATLDRGAQRRQSFIREKLRKN